MFSGVTVGCNKFTDTEHYALYVHLPRDFKILDDSIFDIIEHVDLYQNRYLVFQSCRLEPITVNLSSSKLAGLKGLHFMCNIENSISDELFCGWDTLEHLWLGGSTGPGLMLEYPVNLANHKNLKHLFLGGYGIYYGGPGFATFIKEFCERHPEHGSFCCFI